MSEKNGVAKDTSLPLGVIRDRTESSSLISSVLKIVDARIASTENWLKRIECLYVAKDNEEPSGKRRRVEHGSVAADSSELLRRRYINLMDANKERYIKERPYVAVSYTWQASKEEEAEEEAKKEPARRYLVESRNAGEPALANKVRPMIWDRVLNYAEHVGCKYIWIDKECIDQENEAEKEAAIQSMHLVYKLSEWPIALLTRRIKTTEELDLLTNLMCNDVAPEDEPAVLYLLDDITSDLWWTRAWTFQEDYRASTRMTLLLPHHWSLERRKRAMVDDSGRYILGKVEGEICIKSVDFRERATEFCLSYRERSDNVDICNRIIKRAAKYNVLLNDKSSEYSASRSMSPTILSDILSRSIQKESDRLAIMANCCEYGTRINTNYLNNNGISLSLSILAQYLLNGEIIENNPKRPILGTLKHNIHEYLSKQSLSNFRPPVQQGLKFIKGCRFMDPRLTLEGALTRGHLWKLGKVIRRKPMKVYGASYTDIATELIRHAYDRSRSSYRGALWLDCMAGEVEEALMQGKALRLGCLVDPRNGIEYSPYSAVFVGDSRDDWKDEDEDEDDISYAFTSYQFHKEDMPGYTEKHVSLEVEIEWQRRERSEGRSSCTLPNLYIKRWLNGLCFFDGVPTGQVLFPWHPTLLEEA
ncbi:heterokaryon incompatibility protein-domain-containing protein [Daldinia vernicosa]|uniref:heterokaryon incompatibility protein-domain-containing protein n=1 Tax=Daldinia vernicosa TaxID=114800 RepID=UPI0020079AC5|nr:heterokaryon incompatibility protein-domain-containing protein [Daldinia vernicosa]KAI0848868.1 heterokaryon incompatibility protein-domain-containing protein [Daldinia vernicosa]